MIFLNENKNVMLVWSATSFNNGNKVVASANLK